MECTIAPTPRRLPQARYMFVTRELLAHVPSQSSVHGIPRTLELTSLTLKGAVLLASLLLNLLVFCPAFVPVIKQRSRATLSAGT